MCTRLFPDIIVVPKSTEDVSKIVKVARHFKSPISVRSGGHSYICTILKPEGIHLDLRRLNRIQLTNRYPVEPPGPALILGPGSTWARVQNYVPKDKYTMVHGQCLSVGVGGFLLAGGYNLIGITQRYGTGAMNVLQFTMVDAKGRIIIASENNITSLNPITGRHYQIKENYDLFRSLQIAGSSFGIVTEFHYQIFNEL